MERQNSTTIVYTELSPNKILSLKPEPEEKIKSINLKKKPKRKVEWKEDTVDNENLNRLKSNNCCIYHKPRNLNGDNSSSSSTCTSDDDLNGIERSRETKKKHKKICSKHKDKHSHECENHHIKN